MQAQQTRAKLTDAEIRELKEVFDLMDKDKGGTLTAEEVFELLQLLGMKNVRLDDVRQMIAETDKDGSGSVDFEEFLQLKHCQHMLDAEEISRLVHTLEVKPDGYIHFKDLVQLFMNT